jgi:UDP-N-acetyl-2-amino-2-deoxyglucuronate dehydrogenase
MFPSIISDELGIDITKGLPIIKSWGLEYVDLRGQVFGYAAESLPAERLPELRRRLDVHGLKVGCLQTSLAKVHLPGAERQRAEEEKLEGIIRAADALDCRLVRSFHYWQPRGEMKGELAVRPDELQNVLDMFRPLADRAREARLVLTFENCGVTPQEVFAFLDALDVPQWALAWDVINSWDSDERRRDEDAFIQRMAARSKLVHVKARGAVEGCGEELVPYDKVLAHCHNAGIPGPVSAETHNPDRENVSNVELSERVVQVIQRAWPTSAPGAAGLATAESVESVTRPWADEPVGFLVVGLGMGHGRSKEIVKTSGCRLVGVADVREDRARRTSEECGVPYKTDFREWLDDDAVEVVFVLTETGRHAEVGLAALEAGKHVMTTKPMEATLDACDEMIRVAEAKDRLLAVDFNRRFTTEFNTLREVISQGKLGRMLNGTNALKIRRTMDYFHGDGGWRGTRRWDGGGVLSNQAVHHIDVLAFALGVPARVQCNVWTQIHDIEAEDFGTAVWHYDNGLVITFTATTTYPAPTWYTQLDLVGTEGAYAHVSSGPYSEPQARWYFDGAWSDRPPLVAEPEWLSAVDNFAAAVRTGAELTCPGRDGRRTQSILDAMYRSSYDTNGGWVDVRTEP